MVQPFIPNVADAFDRAQARLDSQDFRYLQDALNRIGVISGCAVTQLGSPAMAVQVASGEVLSEGFLVQVAGEASVSIGAAHATLDRWDIVSVDPSDGSIEVTVGTGALAADDDEAGPTFPAIPDGNVVLAAVLVKHDLTAVLDQLIAAKRCVLGDPGVSDLQGAGPPFGINGRQKLTTEGEPAGGNFTLVYDGQTTSAIAFDATVQDVQAALEALSNIGVGDVECNGDDLPAGPVSITFTGALGAQPITLTLGANNLTGGSSPEPVLQGETTGAVPTVGTALAEIQYDTEFTGLHVNVGSVAVPDWRTVQTMMAFDANGHFRAEFTVSNTGTATVITVDDNGNETVILNLSEDDGFNLQFLVDGVSVGKFVVDEAGFLARLQVDSVNLGEMATVEGGMAVSTDSNGGATAKILTGTADPTAGGGVAANFPALYIRSTGSSTELYRKTGAGDTQWTQVA